MKQLIFGSSYYDEYMPYERLEQDMKMMADAHFNTVRIAESTWSVLEPEPDVFDFTSIDRVIQAAKAHGLQVIIGTPTYAVPYWLVQLDENVLADSGNGRSRFGSRQNMDITNSTYRYHAERVIRHLAAHTAGTENVIGYQIDNETKHYFTSGRNVIARFRQWLKQRFQTIENLNHALGLNYWSNSVTSFEMLPSPAGTMNGSYACEFELFQRSLAAEFLMWQSEILKEYIRDDQFITQNFDFAWQPFGPALQNDGYSRGIQPDICHFDAAKSLTIAGTDIYCFTQDRLTGREIAFGGDEIRCLKHSSYINLECQAQAFTDWLPYPGQLTLMAYSHIASGSCGMLYWHWHSLHNGFESYWRGILSHDMQSNPCYEEICQIGQSFQKLSPKLTGLVKKNRTAVIVSSETLTALKWFATHESLDYNDIIRWIYDTLYNMNVECDILYEQEQDWSGYDLVIFPALYSAPESFIEKVRAYTAGGGTIFATFRSFAADEHAKIYHDTLPHGLCDVFGMTYNQFTRPVHVSVNRAKAEYWMELLKPSSAKAVFSYQHKYWNAYAALTKNRYGKGTAWYLGTMLPETALRDIFRDVLHSAGIPVPEETFPIVMRNCISAENRNIRFMFNYSDTARDVPCCYNGTDLLTGQYYQTHDTICLPEWGSFILEEG